MRHENRTALHRQIPFATAGSKFVTGIAVLAIVWLSLTLSAVSAEIQWANFQRRSAPPVLLPIWDGLSPELDVTATFAVATGSLNQGSFSTQAVLVTDPDWLFENRGVPGLIVAPPVDFATYSLTFEYNNSGGLPAGGSIFLADIESPDTTVHFIGLVGGSEVDVDWRLVSVPVFGTNVPFPLWDPLINTLTGNAGGGGSGINAVFLSTNRALDSVRLEISTGFTDGLIFNTAAQPAILVPEPTSAPLAAIALLNCVMMWRRRIVVDWNQAARHRRGFKQVSAPGAAG